MTDDLVARMRMCAAYFAAYRDDTLVINPQPFVRAVKDAMDLLVEAADALDKVPQPLGEPMEIIAPLQPKPPAAPGFSATWIDPGVPDLPHPHTRPSSRACPSCGSYANKKVLTVNNRISLQCPGCSATWPYAGHKP